MLVRYVAIMLSAGAVAVAAPPASAAENVLERDDINASFRELHKIIANVEVGITTAENSLGDVKAMTIKDEDAMIDDTIFGELKREMIGMLDGLAPNSVLMDNLEGAKANVIVFMRWYERQPPDFRNRDQHLMRLEEVSVRYEDLTDEILIRRQDIQGALRDLLRTKFYQSLELKVAAAEESVEVTKRLVASLRELGTKIHHLAKQEIPNPIPN